MTFNASETTLVNKSTWSTLATRWRVCTCTLCFCPGSCLANSLVSTCSHHFALSTSTYVTILLCPMHGMHGMHVIWARPITGDPSSVIIVASYTPKLWISTPDGLQLQTVHTLRCAPGTVSYDLVLIPFHSSGTVHRFVMATWHEWVGRWGWELMNGVDQTYMVWREA